MKPHEIGLDCKSNLYFYTASSQAKRTFYYPICVGHFYYKANYRLTRDSYHSFLIMYVMNGDCKVMADSRTYQVKSGQIVIIDCYKPHEYYSENGWEALWIHFDGVTAREYYNLITSNLSTNVVTLKDTYQFHKYLKKIYDVFQSNNIIKEAFISSYITNILTELTLVNSEYDTYVNQKNIIEKVIRYINEHIKEELSLKKLSSLASLSPYYFTRVFKKEVGMPPHEYIIETRMTAAKFYLKTSTLTIKEIAGNLGFSNESSFCTTFKKRENLTPTEYRLFSNKNHLRK